MFKGFRVGTRARLLTCTLLPPPGGGGEGGGGVEGLSVAYSVRWDDGTLERHLPPRCLKKPSVDVKERRTVVRNYLLLARSGRGDP